MAPAGVQGALEWRIGEFADRVGVPAATLRAWERRYGVLQPRRTSGGYRVYTTADEERLATVLSHVRQGLSPARAAERALMGAAVSAEGPAAATAVVDRLMEGVAAYDADVLESALDAAFALGTVPGIRDVLLPALVRIGEAWERDELTVGHEHFATNLIERRLVARARGWERGDGPLAVLACPSGERHTLGLQCAGLCLADLGWCIGYLGADTPVDQVARFARAVDARVVLLCAIEAGRLTASAGEIAALAAARATVLAGAGASHALAARLGCRAAPANPAVIAELTVFAARSRRGRARAAPAG